MSEAGGAAATPGEEPAPGPAVGVDVGGTKVLGLALASQGGGFLAPPVRVATPPGPDAVVEAVAAVVEEVCRTAAASAPGTAGAGPRSVGVGLPGLVDRRGVLRVGPNLAGIVDVAFGDRLARRLGVPVAVDNDANCAMWAEHELGAARGADEAILVTLGTGIGAGLVAGGRLHRGANGFAAEAGHMVVDPNGPRCPCGARGCWERFGSGSGLGRLARDEANAGRAARIVALAGGDAEAVRGEHVTRAASEGDPEALAVMADFGWWVALGVANLVNLLDPSVVVVGGGLAEVGELLLAPVREAFAGLVLAGQHRPAVPIVAAELGEEAGAIGAALLGAARSAVGRENPRGGS